MFLRAWIPVFFIIICDRSRLKGRAYSGVPKFIAEILSPSTAKRDRAEKKDIHEKTGVEEYWIVCASGQVRGDILSGRREICPGGELYPPRG
nr:Uma2 family endonuclease [uncultured Acetatifactor sp.]